MTWTHCCHRFDGWCGLSERMVYGSRQRRQKRKQAIGSFRYCHIAHVDSTPIEETAGLSWPQTVTHNMLPKSAERTSEFLWLIELHYRSTRGFASTFAIWLKNRWPIDSIPVLGSINFMKDLNMPFKFLFKHLFSIQGFQFQTFNRCQWWHRLYNLICCFYCSCIDLNLPVRNDNS